MKSDEIIESKIVLTTKSNSTLFCEFENSEFRWRTSRFLRNCPSGFIIQKYCLPTTNLQFWCVP